MGRAQKTDRIDAAVRLRRRSARRALASLPIAVALLAGDGAHLATAATAATAATIDAATEVDEGARSACPIDMALVDGEACADVRHRCIEAVEGDPAHRCLVFAEDGDECVPPRTRRRFCMDRYEWPGVPGEAPRVLVTYYEADALCRSVGKRMCEEDELYLACEGPEHWPFAWGHVRHPSPCNIDRPYIDVDWEKWERGGEEARRKESARLDQALPIGTSKCWSPYGIHDLAGNVDEWTHARPGREQLGSLNGGYWGPVANACRYVTLVHGPEFAFYQIGFRCCAGAN